MKIKGGRAIFEVQSEMGQVTLLREISQVYSTAGEQRTGTKPES